MTLIIEKGYSGATTKNITALAGVNECTIFRRFREKKEIVLAALEMPKWNPGLKNDEFVFPSINHNQLHIDYEKRHLGVFFDQLSICKLYKLVKMI